jgi:uncharacterized protein YndB with AHSA1/START domain
MTKTKTRTIDLKVTVPASPEAVWKALTEADQLASWFAPEARVTPGVGGKIFVSWGGGVEVEAPITLWEPGRRLAHAMGPAPLSVEYQIEGKDGQTTLRLVHSGIGDDAAWDEEFDSLTRGWTLFLRNLVHFLTRHPGKRARQVAFSFRTSLAREHAFTQLARDIDPSGSLRATAPGGSYGLVTAAGDSLLGMLEVYTPGRDLAMTLANLDDALLRVTIERADHGSTVYVALLSYGVDPARVEPLATHLRELVFALPPVAAPAAEIATLGSEVLA